MKKYLSLFFLFAILNPVYAKDVPPTPENLSYSIKGKDVLLEWDEVVGSEDQPVMSYKVLINKDGEDLAPVNTENTNYSFIFEYNVNYLVYVKALNEFGESDQSEYLLFLVENEDEVDVSIISGPDIKSSTPGSVVLEWQTNVPASPTIYLGVHPFNLSREIVGRSLLDHREEVIDGLHDCVKYFYKIVSYDEWSNLTESRIYDFTTTCFGDILADDLRHFSENESPEFGFFNGNKVRINLNRELFFEDSVLQVKKLDPKDVMEKVDCPVGERIIGSHVYDFKVLESSNPKSSFDEDVYITMSYEESDIVGINEDDISMYRYNELLNSWQKLDSCVLEKNSKTITCKTQEFSKFMLGFERSCEPFLKTMFLGSFGGEVKRLQQYLNQSGFIVSKKGLGSSGRETSFFGPKTLIALVKYQKQNRQNISKSEMLFGVLGPTTRAIIR